MSVTFDAMFILSHNEYCTTGLCSFWRILAVLQWGDVNISVAIALRGAHELAQIRPKGAHPRKVVVIICKMELQTEITVDFIFIFAPSNGAFMPCSVVFIRRSHCRVGTRTLGRRYWLARTSCCSTRATSPMWGTRTSCTTSTGVKASPRWCTSTAPATPTASPRRYENLLKSSTFTF